MHYVAGRKITTLSPLGLNEVAGQPLADQLFRAYLKQILIDGFFHADPHPGNLMWWNEKIYFLDLGMVGEIEPATKELLLLLLLAFWQEDSSFLGDILLMLAGDERRPDLDMEGFRRELGVVMARYRHSSLRELRLGPLLEELTEISLRHDLRMPAALALAGKAFGQMQLATAELDPTLDPFSVAGSFFFKQLTDRAREVTNPRRMVYEGQKLVLRLTRLMEGVERVLGARSGPSLQVHRAPGGGDLASRSEDGAGRVRRGGAPGSGDHGDVDARRRLGPRRAGHPGGPVHGGPAPGPGSLARPASRRLKARRSPRSAMLTATVIRTFSSNP